MTGRIGLGRRIGNGAAPGAGFMLFFCLCALGLGAVSCDAPKAEEYVRPDGTFALENGDGESVKEFMVLPGKPLSWYRAPKNDAEKIGELSPYSLVTLLNRVTVQSADAPWILAKGSDGTTAYLPLDGLDPVGPDEGEFNVLVLPGGAPYLEGEKTGRLESSSVFASDFYTGAYYRSLDGKYVEKARCLVLGHLDYIKKDTPVFIAGSGGLAYTKIFDPKSGTTLEPGLRGVFLNTADLSSHSEAALSKFKKPALVSLETGGQVWVPLEDLLFFALPVGDSVLGARLVDTFEPEPFYRGLHSTLERWKSDGSERLNPGAEPRGGVIFELRLEDKAIPGHPHLFAKRALDLEFDYGPEAKRRGETFYSFSEVEEVYSLDAESLGQADFAGWYGYALPLAVNFTSSAEDSEYFNFTLASLSERIAGNKTELSGTFEYTFERGTGVLASEGESYEEADPEGDYYHPEVENDALREENNFFTAKVDFSFDVVYGEEGGLRADVSTAKILKEGWPPGWDIGDLVGVVELLREKLYDFAPGDPDLDTVFPAFL